MTVWFVGQEVILRERSHRGAITDVPVVITRVGRKYVYTQRYGREIAFSKSDGIESGSDNYKARLFMPESLAEYDRRATASARLRSMTNGWGWTDRLSTEAMEQIADLIDGDVR